MQQYYFSEDTINHFRFISSYLSEEEVLNEIEEFIENCTLMSRDSALYLQQLLNKQIK